MATPLIKYLSQLTRFTDGIQWEITMENPKINNRPVHQIDSEYNAQTICSKSSSVFPKLQSFYPPTGNAKRDGEFPCKLDVSIELNLKFIIEFTHWNFNGVLT